ncbi:MAG: hypothetical protein Q9227_006039 [Pyrenula ochraceoflavens]
MAIPQTVLAHKAASLGIGRHVHSLNSFQFRQANKFLDASQLVAIPILALTKISITWLILRLSPLVVMHSVLDQTILNASLITTSVPSLHNFLKSITTGGFDFAPTDNMTFARSNPYYYGYDSSYGWPTKSGQTTSSTEALSDIHQNHDENTRPAANNADNNNNQRHRHKPSESQRPGSRRKSFASHKSRRGVSGIFTGDVGFGGKYGHNFKVIPLETRIFSTSSYLDEPRRPRLPTRKPSKLQRKDSQKNYSNNSKNNNTTNLTSSLSSLDKRSRKQHHNQQPPPVPPKDNAAVEDEESTQALTRNAAANGQGICWTREVEVRYEDEFGNPRSAGLESREGESSRRGDSVSTTEREMERERLGSGSTGEREGIGQEVWGLEIGGR